MTKDKTEKERVSQSSMHDTKKSTTRTLATPHFKMGLTMGNGIVFLVIFNFWNSAWGLMYSQFLAYILL